MLALNRYYKLSEIIEYVKWSGDEGDDFCLYGEDDQGLNLEDDYFLADYPKVEDDQEVYPESVKAEGLDYIFSGQHCVDVVRSVLEQKPKATHEEYSAALNYYADHDTFMDVKV